MSTNTITVLQNHVIDVAVNTNLGSTTGSPLVIYQFPKTGGASYSSGKFLVQVKNNGQIETAEMVLVQNSSSDAQITVFGTTSSPASMNAAPLLGTFDTQINNSTGNVELRFTQSVSNSSVTVVANLIK